MILQKDMEKIKKEAEGFFRQMTFEVELESLSQEGQTVSINIKAVDPQVLIGEKGQTLIEIQQLLGAMLKRKIKELFFINLDINNYKKKKIEYLKEMARNVADEVSLTKKEKILDPMPAYERRIIHLELSERTDVTTESFGQEPLRKIVIKPCF